MAKLVDSLGQLKLVNLPTTVAELMLEHPGFAIAPMDELRETRRITAMRADDVLHGRKVYLLVPVDKVNSRLTELQMAAIDSLVCSCKGGRTRGGSKVSPDLEANGLDGQSLEDLVKDLSEKCTGLTRQRKRICKVWEPVLEPILEGC
uniref:Uncharacterized protein n=1 Tax=Chenopodium quinoa TaxID=63459 RepID=A0A803LF66_CHEQI